MRLRVALMGEGEDYMESLEVGNWVGPVVAERLE